MDGFEYYWAISPACPFCGGHDKKLEKAWTSKTRPHQYFWITCNMCGSTGARADNPTEAVMNWNGRAIGSYEILGEHGYILPTGQKWSYVQVYEKGNVSFIDTVNDEEAGRVEIDLGHYRLARWWKGSKDE